MPKKLAVNVSSLVDLKAELYRKQAQNKKKAAGKAALPLFVTSEKPLISKEAAASREAATAARGRRIVALEADVMEEEKRLRNSKAALERKAALYDQMKASQGTRGASSCLVNFDLAAAAEANARDEKEEEDGKDGDWVEFTDTFGRQRRCLKEDLPSYLSADNRASDKLTQNSDSEETAGPSGVLEVDRDRRSEEPRGPKEAHYQALLKNEARDHGVGYYEFSKDEETRKTQMEQLNAMRLQTLSQRNRAVEVREKRKAKMAERLDKVRARKRLRGGEAAASSDEEDVGAIPLPASPQSLTERLEKELKDADERIRARQRDIHVRDWDRGKPKFSQEKWMDEQRKSRPSEFAPPSTYE